MNKSLIAIIVLILFVGLTSWLRNIDKSDSPKTLATKSHSPDYFLDDFLMKHFTEQGTIAFTVKGDQLNHFQDDESIEITKPYIRWYDKQNTVWHIVSEHALAKSEALDEIWLKGDVRMHRETGPNIDSITINTQKLLLKPKAGIAETQERVNIKTNNAFITTNQGMHANIKNDVLSLFIAETEYEPENP